MNSQDTTKNNNTPKIVLKDIKNSKICIIYVYYERKNETKNQTNLSYFIKYGLDETKWLNLDITTIIVINGFQCEIVIPNKKNIHIIKQDNCTDYEGWLNGINYISNKNNKPIEEQFDYLCLINASTFGPFMDPDNKSHWLCPFYESMLINNSVACSPYINVFKPNTDHINLPVLSCSFTLLKIDKNIIDLLTKTPVISTERNSPKYTSIVLSKKNSKVDAILTGEFGLSRILQINNYNICCLYKNNHRPSDPSYDREEFFHINNEFLKDTIFIKNVWRTGEPYYYASKPILYDYCINFMNRNLKYKNIFDGLDLIYDYNLLNINHNNKKDFFHNFGYAEEYILFPKKKYNSKSVVIYAHYDSNNIIADYVIQGIKSLIYIGYDILFYTASSSINNINLNILPFNVHFVKNKGAGTDWLMFLNGLELIKKEKLIYEWIMFINDSALLPINGITNLMNSIQNVRKNCDFWGHWLSNEIQTHLVFTINEFKYILLEDIIKFIANNITLCNTKNDYVYKLEIPFTKYLLDKKYKMDSVIKYTELTNNHLCCPMFNPLLLKQWINNPNSFAIKWKYCISYLKNTVVSEEFNFLTKYLYYGPYGTISEAEKMGAFPKSILFI